MPEALREETWNADAVVIGSGAGGAPVAARLAEAGLRVIVLEAGPRLETSQFSGDEGEMTALLYAVSQTTSRSSLYAGACVGGSTVINDALCWRPPPEVLAEWRDQHGLDVLTDAAFAPFVDEAWSALGASPTTREHLNRNAWLLEKGARRLGWSGEAMPRSVQGCAHLGLCNFGCPSGAKQSTLRTFVPRAERAGARVIADTRVDRIEIANGAVRTVHATRVDARSRRPAGSVRIDTSLVVAAGGVLGTPALLLRSGVTGRVGEGVQCHSSIHVTAHFDEPVFGYYGPTMAYAITQFSDVHGHDGPGFMLENTAVHAVATASALPGFGDAHARRMGELPHLARALVVLRDRTRGRITLGDAGAARVEHALIEDDRRRLAQGMVAIARAFLAAGAIEVILPIEGSSPIRSEREISPFDGAVFEPARASLLYAVHLFGGACMGGQPESSVCDADGRVRGARGVFVSDASVLPTNLGANPQVTIVANALRIASRILEAHGVSDARNRSAPSQRNSRSSASLAAESA